MIRRAKKGLGPALLVSLGSSLAWAQDPPAGPSPPIDDPITMTARELHRHGFALLSAGDTERALEYFMRSRSVKPTVQNTANAAICLDRLGRYDEALELYEELLTQYKDGLDAEDRSAVEPAMAALRRKVGNIAVSSNVSGALVIDGRARGKLPLLNPVRVLGGKHVIRVIRAGYATFEQPAEVTAGETIEIDAKLEPLRGVGQLVIEDGAGEGSEVFVDRVKVGTTPWEGSLAPGRHTIWTRKAELGSAPTSVVVLEGQAALARVESRPLGPEVSIHPEPRTAALAIDGVPLGAGAWTGRLPAGSYAVEVSEPGYHPRTEEVIVPVKGAPLTLPLRLALDPTHPRWPARASGHLWVDAFGGWAGGGTLDSGAEEGCPERCAGDPFAHGFMVGVRGGYRFALGLSLELGGGYMSLSTDVRRTERDTSGGAISVRYDLVDDLWVRGPFGSVGLSYRRDLGRFHVTGRTSVGVLFARASDPLEGVASTGGESVPVAVERRGQILSSAALFVAPELGAGVRVGPFDLGLAMGVTFFTTEGPTFDRGRFGADGQANDGDASAVGNTQESDVVANERAHGTFALLTPRVSLGRTF